MYKMLTVGFDLKRQWLNPSDGELRHGDDPGGWICGSDIEGLRVKLGESTTAVMKDGSEIEFKHKPSPPSDKWFID